MSVWRGQRWSMKGHRGALARGTYQVIQLRLQPLQQGFHALLLFAPLHRVRILDLRVLGLRDQEGLLQLIQLPSYGNTACIA